MNFVKIPEKNYEMMDAPVTQSEWEELTGENPSRLKGPDRPVESVSYHDVQKFIEKLNSKNDGYKYRLPTEDEWEHACRAGTTTQYYYGDDPKKLSDYAWYWENSDKQTHPVRQKKPNAWGLYDMHGNVWEWTSSEW